jgi:predicted nucleic acid-binding protein
VSLVIDCSVTMAWLLPDENSKTAAKALRLVAKDGAMAPALWMYETQNALLVAKRRRRVDAEFVKRGLRALRKLSITFPPIRNVGRELALADRLGLTAYDAAYLVVALEEHATLATLDDKLASAAASRGIALL